ncbi:MBL fold metallo-hydrolase [Bradyrhizobium sp. WSM471]|uniref:MBL fold metallo-hydrolase n=1 Tax=Bradyrhizobium sp. WSM471 TaxID=319017 RepID=UPI00024D1A96|nr:MULTISPECIES: MBL fold metallo-hydrolase [Bradyrhizobium]EHQ99529.1 metal-dependent hydrolase, beta-lactamase superfamily III [Bradyrhizobium sp. WSM471]UFW41689.1 MBL fold metallo-hydrolase [Bradyrhizobium canariense]
MSNPIGHAVRQALTRRGFIAGSAISLFAPMISSAVAGDGSVDTRIQLAQISGDVSNSRSRLILLGTSGGPTWYPNSDQSGISSVVAVGDAYYIVDCGEGAGKRLQQAISPASSRFMDDRVRALFLTHLHSDHTVDYANLLFIGLFVGLDRRSTPFKVFGPGRRGQMAPVFSLPGTSAPTVPIINPENPTPGIKDMTGYLYQAFATDLNDRMRDNGKPNLEAVVEVHDIDIPAIAGFKSPNETPSPPMEPFKIFEDDRVRVSATLVDHAPVWPAFAYRFDTDDGSIVFSGDTGRCENLIKLAKGADVLVHEVIVTSAIYRAFPTPRSVANEGLVQHLLNAHTQVEEVGAVAEAAGVKKLVLSHIVPGNATREQLLPAGKGFSGELVIGRDLMQIGIGQTAASPQKG